MYEMNFFFASFVSDLCLYRWHRIYSDRWTIHNNFRSGQNRLFWYFDFFAMKKNNNIGFRQKKNLINNNLTTKSSVRISVCLLELEIFDDLGHRFCVVSKSSLPSSCSDVASAYDVARTTSHAFVLALALVLLLKPLFVRLPYASVVPEPEAVVIDVESSLSRFFLRRRSLSSIFITFLLCDDFFT